MDYSSYEVSGLRFRDICFGHGKNTRIQNDYMRSSRQSHSPQDHQHPCRVLCLGASATWNIISGFILGPTFVSTISIQRIQDHSICNYLGPYRFPRRMAFEAPGSEWTLDLGRRRPPCDRKMETCSWLTYCGSWSSLGSP